MLTVCTSVLSWSVVWKISKDQLSENHDCVCRQKVFELVLIDICCCEYADADKREAVFYRWTLLKLIRRFEQYFLFSQFINNYIFLVYRHTWIIIKFSLRTISWSKSFKSIERLTFLLMISIVNVIIYILDQLTIMCFAHRINNILKRCLHQTTQKQEIQVVMTQWTPSSKQKMIINQSSPD